MDFYLADDTPLNQVQRDFWDTIVEALADEPGVCFADFTITGKTGHLSTIDFFIAHQKWGLYIIQTKDYELEDIQDVDDIEWIVSDIVRPNPYRQVVFQLQALFSSVRDQIDLAATLRGFTFIGLLNITRQQWQDSDYEQSARIPNTLFADDLTPEALKSKLQGIVPKKQIGSSLNDNQWQVITTTLVNQYAATNIPPEVKHDTRTRELPIDLKDYERDAPSIFISYRRQDSAWAVLQIHDYLDSHFGQNVKIFVDVDSIGFGDRFDTVIEDEIKKSNVLLIIIGHHWMQVSHPNGMRRLDDPKDYVVKEISTALEYKKKIIPILLDNAPMPSEGDLPKAIADLGLYHAFKVSPENFHRQMPLLIKRLEYLVKPIQEIIAEARTDLEAILKGRENQG